MTKSIEVNLLEVDGKWPLPQAVYGSTYFIEADSIQNYESAIIGKSEKIVPGTLITLTTGEKVGVSDKYEYISEKLGEI